MPRWQRRRIEALSGAIDAGLVASCHDCSDGGLAVALAETAFAGGLGMDIDLNRVPTERLNKDAQVLFSESASRFVVTVSTNNTAAFERAMEGVPCAMIGTVRDDERFLVRGLKGITCHRHDGRGFERVLAVPAEVVTMVSTKSQIKSLVITGYGINCEYETAYANTLAGAEATIAHINDVIAGQYRLEDYQILNFPGGWSFGDDLGSGKVFVNKLLYAKTPTGPLADQILKFIDDGKLVIGICNGFQILVKMGLLPALDKDYKTQSCTLFFNDHGFRDSWVKLKVNQKSPCIFTKGIDMLDAPIRHGEGKFIPESRQLLDRLTRNGQVVMQYVDRFGRPTQEFPANPNGSTDAIAGICDETGRVFGLMPHPEAFNHITNHPHYTRMREEAARKKLPLKEEGDGIQIWRNAVEYARQKLI